jgi:hypothetical protein
MKKMYKKLIIGLLMLIVISSLNATLKEGSFFSKLKKDKPRGPRRVVDRPRPRRSFIDNAKTLQRFLEKGKGVISMYVDMPI